MKFSLLIAYIFLGATTAFAVVGPAYTPPDTPETVNDVFFSFAWGNMKGFIPALIAVGLVVFLSGVVKYIRSGDNEEGRQNGRSMMIYGIIVLFVMISFWGLTNILVQSFFPGKSITIPNRLPLQ